MGKQFPNRFWGYSGGSSGLFRIGFLGYSERIPGNYLNSLILLNLFFFIHKNDLIQNLYQIQFFSL